MEVEIPLDLREYIEFLVNAGRYSSPSEVLVAALKALNEKESTIPLSDGELIAMYPNINELIAEGLAEADAGKCTDGEEFFAELERELSQETAPDRKTA